jgi:hypothetical protein
VADNAPGKKDWSLYLAAFQGRYGIEPFSEQLAADWRRIGRVGAGDGLNIGGATRLFVSISSRESTSLL